MPAPAVQSFQRIYRDASGLEYPADLAVVAVVLKSMADHAGGPDPFKVRLRMADGSSVVVKPKRAR